MDKLKLVDKLREKANISYEEAKKVLEDNDWDILEAILFLESTGKVKKPKVSTFYTNKVIEDKSYNGEIVTIDDKKQYDYYNEKKSFHGVFEAICKVIDMLNNIFVEIYRNRKILVKLPMIVIIVLLFFAFWIIIPSVAIALFFDIEFVVSTKIVKIDNLDKVNNVLSQLSKNIKILKEKIKKEV